MSTVFIMCADSFQFSDLRVGRTWFVLTKITHAITTFLSECCTKYLKELTHSIQINEFEIR